jgi:predicted ATP-binding protein involved in virulence
MDCYITDIHINKLRHLHNIDISLAKDKRQHLLITGKNGSGKTSLLDALFLQLENATENTIVTTFSTGNYRSSNTLTSYFRANRHLKVDIPKGVEQVTIPNNGIEHSKVLVKYLVDLKTQQSYARNEEDFQVADNIQAWFDTFEGILRKIFENDSLKLKYDYKNYNFSIVIPNREPFGFNEISDGYSALVMILAELILKMDNNQAIDTREHLYTQQGIVLIDELETHLHVELQKKILPLLVDFFPNVQFIVTTHSPFILNSIENATIYDLENHITIEDMSDYSYEAVVETYFNVSKYSNDIQNKFSRYKELVSKVDLTTDERIERATLRNELENISGDYAQDIKVAFNELESKRLSNG